LQPPGGLPGDAQRAQLDLLARSTATTSPAPQDTELSARIESFELAFRMQTTAPEAFDVEREPDQVKQLYGLDQPHCRISPPSASWPGAWSSAACASCRSIPAAWKTSAAGTATKTSSATTAALPTGNRPADRRPAGRPRPARPARRHPRHLGRRIRPPPVSQKGAKPGRDHNPHAFTYWLAGGGAKGGVHHGATDELGHKAAVDTVSVNDLHATILHLLGFDHEKLTYYHNGRHFRLTDVAGEVVQAVVA
jgi:hypothetical protein